MGDFVLTVARSLLHARIVPSWPSPLDLNGVQVPLAEAKLPRWTRRALLMGIYEAAERGFVAKWILPGEHVLELGASLGIVSSVIGKTIGARGKLVSVEANEDLAPAFRRQLAMNRVDAKLVHCLACPIWAREAPLSVRRQTYTKSADSLAGRAEMNPSANEGNWLTAAQLCEENDITPTALVVDIEGAEGVWADCPPSFPQELTTIIAEFHPGIIGGTDTARSISAVVREGFELVDMNGDVVVFAGRDKGYVLQVVD